MVMNNDEHGNLVKGWPSLASNASRKNSILINEHVMSVIIHEDDVSSE